MRQIDEVNSALYVSDYGGDVISTSNQGVGGLRSKTGGRSKLGG